MRRTEYSLTEREAELSALERCLLAAQSGTGRVVLIEGPAGGGKTSLLSAAHQMAERFDMQAPSAAGSELERGFPFGVGIQLVEPWWTAANEEERSALNAGPARLAAQLLDGTLLQKPALSVRRHPVIHGLFSLVSNLASRIAGRSRGGLAILVDDLQQADRPSLRFLAYLALRIADLPIALVAAVRGGEAPHDPGAVWTMQNAPDATVLYPPALSQRGVEQLVRAEFPAASIAFIAACCQVTGGNPFPLTELLAQMRSDRRSPDDATAARLAELVPTTIVNSVVARLGAMSPADRALATAVAVLGDRASLASAARFAELDLEVASRAADSLAAVQLLHRGLPLSFVHPVIRSAVLQHRRRHHVERAGAPGRRARRAGVPTDGQRSRADRPRLAGLVPLLQGRDRVHRPRLPVAEPVRRELPLTRARRAARRRGILLPGRGQGRDLRLARVLQQQAPALRARDARPGRVRRHLGRHERADSRRMRSGEASRRARRDPSPHRVAATPLGSRRRSRVHLRLPRTPGRPTSEAVVTLLPTRIHQLSLAVDRETGYGQGVVQYTQILQILVAIHTFGKHRHAHV